MAKLHIKLIHDVAQTVNNDPAVRGRVKVVFLPNYSVSLAERIIPATDVSEQISMAGKEASGTGNMKFAMNGALTIGTLDGANVEIREAVGEENFFLFGLTAEEVAEVDREGYDPRVHVAASPRLQQVIESLASGFFSPDDPERYRPVIDELLGRDTYKHCADFEPYVTMHEEVARVYGDPDEWTRRVVHNIANVGRFSSDRTIREYARDIWDLEPVPIALEGLGAAASASR
jgi:starch phosphorylase